MDNPLGIDKKELRFSWTFIQDKKNIRQKSVEVLISDKVKDLINDSIFLFKKSYNTSSQMIRINLSSLLKSHTKYYWKVKVYDENNKIFISDIHNFETAKLALSDWKAQWITDGKSKDEKPSPIFRKKFSIKENIISARMYITGAGYCYAWINGMKVGDHVLDPAYTNFNKRIYYSVYDVTDLLSKGDNVISAVLGNGWYNVQSLAVWRFHEANWRERPSLLCELRVNYSDGGTDIIYSDDTWKCSDEAYRSNDIYSGDLYDAIKEKDGWRNICFDDSKWRNAIVRKAPTLNVCSQMFEPIRICDEIRPVSINKLSENLYVFDCGVNISGFSKIRIKGEKGTKVTIKYGERLSNKGRLDQSNIDVYFHRVSNNAPLQPVEGEEFQMDTYIMKGGGKEEFMPLFNYKGFKYIEIESDRPIEIRKKDLTAYFVHTDLIKVGNFSCSNEKLNKLNDAVKRSYLSNMHSIPTDCPQREKNGWTADAWVAIELGLLNYDGIKIYEKWMHDFVDNIRADGRISGIIPCNDKWRGYDDWIGPAWDAAMFIIPYTIYNYYGDSNAIRIIYDSAKKYLDYLETREDKDGLITFGLGDWCPFLTETPNKFTSPCFYYYMNYLMDKFSDILNINDNNKYLLKSNKIKSTINRKFFNEEKFQYANGSITSYALPLYMQIVPDNYTDKLAFNLVSKIRKIEHKSDFGLFGTKTVLRVLTGYGYAEDAYRMAVQPEVPGWMAWIERGMTTLPEQWVVDHLYKGRSYNHVFFGDISAWMYNCLGGINVDYSNPGFSHFNIKPVFIDELDWVKSDYKSIRGLIKSEWKRNKNGSIELKVSVPLNTSASVYFSGKKIDVNGGTHTFLVK